MSSNPNCIHCQDNTNKYGKNKKGLQKYRCKGCKKIFLQSDFKKSTSDVTLVTDIQSSEIELPQIPEIEIQIPEIEIQEPGPEPVMQEFTEPEELLETPIEKPILRTMRRRKVAGGFVAKNTEVIAPSKKERNNQTKSVQRATPGEPQGNDRPSLRKARKSSGGLKVR